MRWWKHLFETVMKEETLSMAFDVVIESKKDEDRRHPERPSRKFASRTFLEERIEPFTSREKNRRILRNESRRIHEISKRAV